MIKKTSYLENRSRTCTYVLPFIGSSFFEFKRNLVQAFLRDEDKSEPGETGKLYLLYEIEREPWFKEYYKFLTENQYYEKSYKIGDNYIMLVYNLGEKGDKVWKLFKRGKYFSLDDKYKKHILSFFGLSMSSSVAKVLYKSEERFLEWEKRIGMKIPRSQDIGEIPNELVEFFKFERMFDSVNEEKETSSGK